MRRPEWDLDDPSHLSTFINVLLNLRSQLLWSGTPVPDIFRCRSLMGLERNLGFQILREVIDTSHPLSHYIYYHSGNTTTSIQYSKLLREILDPDLNIPLLDKGSLPHHKPRSIQPAFAEIAITHRTFYSFFARSKGLVDGRGRRNFLWFLIPLLATSL